MSNLLQIEEGLRSEKWHDRQQAAEQLGNASLSPAMIDLVFVALKDGLKPEGCVNIPHVRHAAGMVIAQRYELLCEYYCRRSADVIVEPPEEIFRKTLSVERFGQIQFWPRTNDGSMATVDMLMAASGDEFADEMLAFCFPTCRESILRKALDDKEFRSQHAYVLACGIGNQDRSASTMFCADSAELAFELFFDESVDLRARGRCAEALHAHAYRHDGMFDQKRHVLRHAPRLNGEDDWTRVFTRNISKLAEQGELVAHQMLTSDADVNSVASVLELVAIIDTPEVAELLYHVLMNTRSVQLRSEMSALLAVRAHDGQTLLETYPELRREPRS